MANNLDKNKREFLKIIPLLEADEFLGLATMLKVNLMEDKDTPRDFVDIFSDVLDEFEKKNRAQRRNLMKILRSATKGKKLEDKLKPIPDDTNIAAEE